jgi:hypothetical protein
MASKKVTLKRVTGASTTDELFPTTTLDQIFISDQQGEITSESLSTYLDNTFINQNQIGASNGLATLSGGKLTASQVPDYIFNGLKFIGSISYSTQPSVPLDLKTLIQGTITTNYTITAQLDSFLPSGTFDFQDIGNQYIGYYWSVNFPLNITDDANAGEADWAVATYDDGVSPQTVNIGGTNYANTLSLEPGDFVIITDFDNNPLGGRFKISVINNTYGNASTAQFGVVKLTGATNVSQLTNGAIEVITEDFLFDNIKTGDVTGIANPANFIASVSHNHDGRYYTETEINNWIGGSSTINSASFTEIIYGASPTGTVVGTILIDED